MSSPLSAAGLDQRLALDVQGVDALRRTVRNSPDEGLREAARQFEAVFMQMVIKSMREAAPADSLLGSQSGRMYQSLYDQQLAQGLSGRGLGLAEAMYAQLAGTARPARALAGEGLPLASAAGAPAGAAAATAAVAATATPAATAAAWASPAAPLYPSLQPPLQTQRPVAAAAAAPGTPDEFIARLRPAAEAASRATGLPARLILAQAALESGWGRREIRGEDGSPSFNVFGIKADRRWHGRSVETATTEYVDGVAQPTRAAFRAYGSYEEAFTDYARFLSSQPRYAPVLAAGDATRAAEALQRAGYATDPGYAAKLVRVMHRIA